MINTITPERLNDFVDLVRLVVPNGIKYRHTMDTGLRHSLPPLERELIAKAEQLHRELNPNCPKCGVPMVGAAPHGPWPVQYECRQCGTIVVPHSAAIAAEGGAA